MTPEKSDEELRAILAGMVAPAAKVSETEQLASSRIDSFTGGMPYFEEGQGWPKCDHCGELMRFVAQLGQQDHKIDFPSHWNLLVFFACGRTDWCLHRGRDGKSSRGRSFAGPDWRAEGGTIAVHHYENPSVDAAITPGEDRAVGEPRALAFTAERALPDQITVGCAPIRGYDPLDLHPLFAGDAVRFGKLSREVSSLECIDSFVGGWPLWGNCVDMTPFESNRPMRHILRIDECIGENYFPEMACLFGDPDTNTFQLVYDGT